MNTNNLSGFYSSLTSSIKKYTGSVALPGLRPEAEGCSQEPSEDEGAQGAEGPPLPVAEPEMPELPAESQLPPGTLHVSGDGLVYKILTEEHSEAAVDLLCNYFFKDEPLGKALHLESPREVDHWLANLLPYLIRHGVSVAAFDEADDKLVGVAINRLKVKNQEPGLDDLISWIDPQKDPKMFRIASFLQQVSEQIDYFEKYQVEKLLSFELLNVSRTHSGRGIASTLVQQSVALAKQRQVTCLLALTTGIFSAKIFARHSFRTIKEVPYATHREAGKLVFPATGIHTSTRVSVRLL